MIESLVGLLTSILCIIGWIRVYQLCRSLESVNKSLKYWKKLHLQQEAELVANKYHYENNLNKLVKELSKYKSCYLGIQREFND